jgi:hypothetical protein
MPWTTSGGAVTAQTATEKPANDAKIETIVEVAADLTSRSRHSFAFAGLAAFR